MPFYKALKQIPVADRQRTVQGIQRLRTQFKTIRLPEKTTDESLILGTWNIRNFDDNRFNFGPRLNESMYYIAEILAQFDVIAVQEICEDLGPLERLMGILGRKYDYILTDVTHSGLGGNDERLGFIYDKDKVKFRGVAGEIVLPDKLLISEVAARKRQFSRTPFGVEFQSGWFKFLFATVHIYFGKDAVNSVEYQRRIKEIDTVARYLAKEAGTSDANQILVGDFNITRPGSEGMNALEQNGFTVVKNDRGSNSTQTKFYDQISFRSRKNELQLVAPEHTDRVLQFFDSVFRAEDFATYRPIIEAGIQKKLAQARTELAAATAATTQKALTKTIESLTKASASAAALEEYYLEWRTFQMSDHLPLWVELKVDYSDQYLEYLKQLAD